MKKLWDFRTVLGYLELEGQGRGIIMRITRPLLLGPFYYVFSYVRPNISTASLHPPSQWCLLSYLKIIQTLHFWGCLPLFHSFILKYFFPHLALTDSKLPNRYCHIARSSKKLTYEWANYATRNFTIFCSFFSALKREKTSIFQSLEKTNSYQKGLWSYFTHLWKKILDRYRKNLLTS